jgi:hypothetical protein
MGWFANSCCQRIVSDNPHAACSRDACRCRYGWFPSHEDADAALDDLYRTAIMRAQFQQRVELGKATLLYTGVSEAYVNFASVERRPLLKPALPEVLKELSRLLMLMPNEHHLQYICDLVCAWQSQSSWLCYMRNRRPV